MLIQWDIQLVWYCWELVKRSQIDICLEWSEYLEGWINWLVACVTQKRNRRKERGDKNIRSNEKRKHQTTWSNKPWNWIITLQYR